MDDNKPTPPKLADLSRKREDEAEAARAKQARDFAAAVETVKACWPSQLEMIALTAKEWRARYLALQKEGFTPAEALELCWRRA